jgi:hypothetical protein
MKHNSVIVGQKTPYNQVFIFSANGKRYKTIELEPLVNGLAQQAKWACMAWNSDEDLVMMTAEGRIIIIDVFLGRKIGDHILPGFTDK